MHLLAKHFYGTGTLWVLFEHVDQGRVDAVERDAGTRRPIVVRANQRRRRRYHGCIRHISAVANNVDVSDAITNDMRRGITVKERRTDKNGDEPDEADPLETRGHSPLPFGEMTDAQVSLDGDCSQ